APKSLAQAVALLAKHSGKARVLAGGTDIIVQLREYRRDYDLLVDVKNIRQLNELTCNPKGKTPELRIGAAVPCYEVCENKNVRKYYPGLVDAVSLIGGVQIQSRASIGGNLCNASPAADTIPALIAGAAKCVIGSAKEIREMPVERFCTGPGKNALAPGELLVSLHLPPPAPRSGGAYLRF